MRRGGRRRRTRVAGSEVKPPISCVLQSPGRGRSVLTSHSQSQLLPLSSNRVQADSQRGSNNQAGSDEADSLRWLLGLLVMSGSEAAS